MFTILFALAWLFVESLGLPLLSEGAFGSLSAAVHNGHISLPTAYLSAYLATIAGNAAGFFVFTLWGPSLREWLKERWPGLSNQMDRIEPRIRTQVFVAMGIARFIGMGVFGVVLWMAGLVRTPWKPFLAYLFALDLIWTAIWLFASHALVGIVIAWIKTMDEVSLVLWGGAAIAGYFLLHRLIKAGIRYFRERTAE